MGIHRGWLVALAFLPWVSAGGAQTPQEALPKWAISEVCAKESAAGQCREFEAQAYSAVSASWSFVPAAIRKSCAEATAAPADQSYRLLSSCLENAYARADAKAAIATAAVADPADVAALRPKPPASPAPAAPLPADAAPAPAAAPPADAPPPPKP